MLNIRTFNELCKRANFPLVSAVDQPDTDVEMLSPSNMNHHFTQFFKNFEPKSSSAAPLPQPAVSPEKLDPKTELSNSKSATKPIPLTKFPNSNQ